MRIGSAFRLWDDADLALAECIAAADPAGDGEAAAEWTMVNPDEPCSSSPLALALAASRCDALVTANLSRADAPDYLSDAEPWITWVTQADRMPAYALAGPRDGVLAADARWRTAAIRAGWPADRVVTAG